jgi:hypothetical protein
MLLFSNAKTIFLLKDHSKEIGPFSAQIQNDFEYIKAHTKPTDVIAFCKPYVINYKCDRNAFVLKRETQDKAYLLADYILIARNPILNEVYEQGLDVTKPLNAPIELGYFYLYKVNKKAGKLSRP